ncbi:MAG: diaminopimelate epimerase [Clostridia bacterium]|nr:diaminopimelate epimerase [Clostridia bacterium]
MKINFTKMHGCGNDYIYVNCFDGELPEPEKISAEMSPRHFSVGSDGLIMVCRSEIADAKMRMFNLDGSEGKMCGNGIRCVGKFVHDYGLCDKTTLDIETKSGIKHLTLHLGDNGKVSSVTVDMGKADVTAKNVPVVAKTETVVDAPVTVGGREYKITCVSMGNPHAVTFVKSTDGIEIEKIGPLFEFDPMFPERVNTEFAEIIDKNTIKMRVWERGSGETYACGTGACATAVAAILNGYCGFDEKITVKLIGGDLEIVVSRDMSVMMTGGATKVYEGVYEYEDKP